MNAKPGFRIVVRDLNSRYRRRLLAVAACSAVLLSAQVVAHDSAETLVLSNGTLPPVTTPEGDGPLDKLYAEWFSRAGLHVELIAIPAARGLENANAGLYDGDAARTKIDSALYPDLHRVSEPVSRIHLYGFHTDPDIQVSELADFEKYSVGYVRGWRMAERIFGGSDNALALHDADGLMDMLAAGRLDIAFLTLVPARKLAEERQMESLRRTEFGVEMYQYLYVHTIHRNKIAILADTLRTMKSDGSYDALMADYHAENR